MKVTKHPKTFVLRGHRYTIVYTTDTEAKAKSVKSNQYDSMSHEHMPTAIKQLSNGRWAIGVRQAKPYSRTWHKFIRGR